MDIPGYPQDCYHLCTTQEKCIISKLKGNKYEGGIMGGWIIGRMD